MYIVDHFFDPAIALCRILFMLSLMEPSLNTNAVQIGCARLAIGIRRKTGGGLTDDLMAEMTDQTRWMLAVRDNRDQEAFAALFDYFAPRLKSFLVRAGSSSAHAEEIVQDVMLTVWRKAALYDPHRAQTSAWIYQIARNRQIDVFRKQSRPIPEEITQDDDAEPDASQILAIEQESRELKNALARLKPDQREIIEKAYMGELSHQEISMATGLPLGTIKSRIRLGLERLRHELKGMR